MNDIVTSVIRTVVPSIVGAILGVLAAHGINLDAQAAANLTGFLTALFGALYYVIVRILEQRNPKAGILLGKAKQPEY